MSPLAYAPYASGYLGCFRRAIADLLQLARALLAGIWTGQPPAASFLQRKRANRCLHAISTDLSRNYCNCADD